MKNFYLIFFLLLSNIFVSQELNCEVVVEARQTGNENLQVFKTLQTQLTEFINSTSWTNKATVRFFSNQWVYGFKGFRLEYSQIVGMPISVVITNFDTNLFQVVHMILHLHQMEQF